MPKLLRNQKLIIGCPGVGKSIFLRNLNNRIFTPIKKEKGRVKYIFAKKSLRETQKQTKRELLKYINTHKVLYLDEPFYCLSPFNEKYLFKKILRKEYVIVTHRLAYFLLSSPLIILINKKRKNMSIDIRDLERIIKRPTLNFFRADLVNYSKFLNGFVDVELNTEFISKIRDHPFFRKVRTTYVIRDFLIWFALNPGDFQKKVDEYKITIRKFFKENYKNISIEHRKLINKCMGEFF